MSKQLVRCPKCKNGIMRSDGRRAFIFNKGIEIDEKEVKAKCRCGHMVPLSKALAGKHVLFRKKLSKGVDKPPAA